MEDLTVSLNQSTILNNSILSELNLLFIRCFRSLRLHVY